MKRRKQKQKQSKRQKDSDGGGDGARVIDRVNLRLVLSTHIPGLDKEHWQILEVRAGVVDEDACSHRIHALVRCAQACTSIPVMGCVGCPCTLPDVRA